MKPLLIYLILLLKSMKPLLHQNILRYVINIFNPPTKKHETPSTPEYPKLSFIKISNPPSKVH